MKKFEAIKKKVLFICTHNSARSQMAEGYLRSKYSNQFEVFSAGTEITSVNPYAIRVMNEIGIDISIQHSKSLPGFLREEIDIVVTVCDNSKSACPFFPGAKKTMHISFPDPTSSIGNEEENLEVFRTVRNSIIQWIDDTFVTLNSE